MAVTIGSVTEGNANAEEIKNNSPDSELYEKNKKYLQGSLVKFNDKIYLAKRNVPGDVDLDNPYYWEIFMDAADSKRVDELFEKTGNLDELETESKDNLVAAINEAVLYTAQSLTEEQKAQARANIGAGTPYTLPQATAEAIGGVKADSADAADTQPVRIGSDGKLYTAPGVTDISTKMDANNPVGKGSFSMNRKAGTAVGAKSHAEGSDTTASGSYSHAEGDRTTASGFNSHAEGGSTNAFSSVVTTTNPTTGDIITAWKTNKFSIAKGDCSHVEGKDNLALEKYSHAEGGGTTASNYYSHAEGSTTTASGFGSHAEGGSTTASKDYSHAEGMNTTASNHYSHAEGTSTTASGYSSHAEGSSTKASGSYSHAEGDSTTASGYSSHAEGLYTTASGAYSHAEGRRTKASGKYSHAQGKFNIEDTSNIYADIIGNGTSDDARSNAATVDWSGNAWFAGDVYTGSTSGTNKDDGSKKLATEEYVNNSIAAGGDNTYYLVKITASSWNLDNATFTIEQTHNEIYEAYQSGKTIIADLYAEENLGDIKQDVYQGRLSTIHVKVRGYIDEIQFIGFVKESRIAYIWAYFDGSQQMYCNGKFIHYVEKDDIVTSISSSSKDSEVPSAKCVYDELQKTDTKSLGLTSAAVGQTIKVKAIDASGKPTAWEAVESGSAEDAVLYTEQVLTISEQAQARRNIDVPSNNDLYQAIEFFNSEFKTHSEICKAYESGKVCYYPYAGTKLMSNAYSGRMQPFVFSGINGNNEFLTVTVNTDDSVVQGDRGIYNLTEVPQATAEAIGGVKADSVEADDTQPVRIGGDGKLYTAAGGTDISLGLTSATVGQTIKVKTVDASGKPTAWEAANMQSGGGETWEKISDVSLTQDVSRYILASFGTYRKIKIMMERDAYVSGLSKNVWVRISSPSSNNFYTVGYLTSEYGYLKWEVNTEVNNAFISGHMISSNNPNASATLGWKLSKELGDTAVSDLSLRLDFTDVSVIQDGDSVSVWGVRW